MKLNIKFKPGMSKSWLYFTSGMVWTSAGVLLNWYSYQWLRSFRWLEVLLLVIGGVSLALTIYKFGFSKFAKKNIQRVEKIETEKPCIFGFQQWTSYPLVALMISMGIYLRKYSHLPKSFLTVIYIGIGGSLFLASFHYFFEIINNERTNLSTSTKTDSY